MKKKNVVLEQIRKYKWGYLFGIILVAMDAIVTYIYPQLITNILDKAVPAKNPGAVISNVAYMAICQLVSITLNFQPEIALKASQAEKLHVIGTLNLCFSHTHIMFFRKFKSCL